MALMLEILPIFSKHLESAVDLSAQFCSDDECNAMLFNGLDKFKDRHHSTKSHAFFLNQSPPKRLQECKLYRHQSMKSISQGYTKYATINTLNGTPLVLK